MVDQRFFSFAGPVTLGEVLDTFPRISVHNKGADLDRRIEGIAEIGSAREGDLVLAAGAMYVRSLEGSAATFVLTEPNFADRVPTSQICLVSDRAHHCFADMLDWLYPKAGRRLSGNLAPDDLPPAIVEHGATIAPSAQLGHGAEIGAGTNIGPNVVIGPNVRIGRNCEIGANSVLECALIGDRVVIHPNVSVGTRGFGWLDHGNANVAIPQLGRVILQSGVEIGPNSTIDRGALGDTSVGENTKLGNLVVIGHNCRIGRNCLFAPTVGLAGSTDVGDGVLMGAGVGSVGHVSVGDGSVVFARAAITKDWPANSKIIGAPAQNTKDFWRELAAIRRLSRGKGHE
ncbi:MAG: UDP-3-O-(3-hydroxymyristoyl)glucosamine N-acyltransferase [Hyphomicrobiaceae bacterium]|nr:UDP-3-O-(3-hydroxymyristoyl)glucosamine N-acyltransferase [Hyphomicrobiaceae bacterium]MCC0023483.1 UDP-3-O-(3-hydroxymyristoyl)glucosamine N-acyltransferase [Hyphomicrobiaceae bacterium]